MTQRTTLWQRPESDTRWLQPGRVDGQFVSSWWHPRPQAAEPFSLSRERRIFSSCICRPTSPWRCLAVGVGASVRVQIERPRPNTLSLRLPVGVWAPVEHAYDDALTLRHLKNNHQIHDRAGKAPGWCRRRRPHTTAIADDNGLTGLFVPMFPKPLAPAAPRPAEAAGAAHPAGYWRRRWCRC